MLKVGCGVDFTYLSKSYQELLRVLRSKPWVNALSYRRVRLPADIKQLCDLLLIRLLFSEIA